MSVILECVGVLNRKSGWVQNDFIFFVQTCHQPCCIIIGVVIERYLLHGEPVGAPQDRKKVVAPTPSRCKEFPNTAEFIITGE